MKERLFGVTALSGCIFSKQKPGESQILQQGPFVPILSCHFGQVFLHYLESILLICKWTVGYSYQLISVESSFRGNNWLSCISFSMVYKIFFLLRIPRSSGKVTTREEKKQQGSCKALCFTSKRKNKRKGKVTRKARYLYLVRTQNFRES